MLLTIGKDFYNPMLDFSFYLYFHIRSSNKNISFINPKMGVVQGMVYIHPTAQPLPIFTVLGLHKWL